LDVSVKETSICIVDEAGRICREMKVVRACKGISESGLVQEGTREGIPSAGAAS
jgi:hypothetical protein